MQLTKFTDLSLRVMMYLTQDDHETPVTINEIAMQFNVPRNHLIKIITRLNKLGWVNATRGRNGGLKLGIEANKLQLGNILRELENSPALINCASPPCSLKGQCNLKEFLDTGLNAFFDHMNTFTLADIMKSKTQQAVAMLHQDYQILLRKSG